MLPYDKILCQQLPIKIDQQYSVAEVEHALSSAAGLCEDLLTPNE